MFYSVFSKNQNSEQNSEYIEKNHEIQMRPHSELKSIQTESHKLN